ncbi:MAG: type VI secretion system tube protein Hcp [Pseudomonadota bacterium]|nr:type VI secretion system tube protein Hcp [Pseudomonadota bacterium]
MSTARCLLAAVTAALVLAGAAHAAGYLKIGDIKGETTEAAGGGKWIEVESFSWGATQSGAPSGKGPGTLTIVQRRGDHSARVERLSRDGAVVPEMVLKSGEPGSRAYLEYKLYNAKITSYSLNASSSADAAPMESLSLNYERISW